MIGLLGGTFDPIHFGHLRTALEVQEAMGLDEIRFLPAPRPRLRNQPIISVEQRVEMVRLAIAGHAGFRLDTQELNREGPSRSIDTLKHTRQAIGDSEPLMLIMGSDVFAKLPLWHQWEQLIELAHIVVMMRPDVSLKADDFPNDWLEKYLTESPDESRELPAGRIFTVQVTQLAISATAIRHSLRQGLSARYLIPETVHEYIEENKLYRG